MKEVILIPKSKTANSVFVDCFLPREYIEEMDTSLVGDYSKKKCKVFKKFAIKYNNVGNKLNLLYREAVEVHPNYGKLIKIGRNTIKLERKNDGNLMSISTKIMKLQNERFKFLDKMNGMFC